jgi:hypothetical protein
MYNHFLIAFSLAFRECFVGSYLIYNYPLQNIISASEVSGVSTGTPCKKIKTGKKLMLFLYTVIVLPWPSTFPKLMLTYKRNTISAIHLTLTIFSNSYTFT